MIADALKQVASMALEGARPFPVETGDPNNLTFLVAGIPVVIPRPEPARKHTANDIESLVSLANRFAESQPAVWVSDDAVRLVIDDAEHRVNTVELGLHRSQVFSRLCDLEREKPWLDQKAFVRLLRIDLAGTLAPGSLLDRVRKLRFESGQVTTQEAMKNRESMGRQITSQVSAEGELPEVVTLEVRVLKLAETLGLACSVDVDPARGLLQLAPLPDEIDRVLKLAVAQIHETIFEHVGENVLVYYGRP